MRINFGDVLLLSRAPSCGRRGRRCARCRRRCFYTAVPASHSGFKPDFSQLAESGTNAPYRLRRGTAFRLYYVGRFGPNLKASSLCESST
jgi:hypothetical protein